MQFFQSFVEFDSHSFVYDFSVFFDFVSDGIQHLFRWIVWRKWFSGIGQRLLIWHEFGLSVLVLLSVRLNLVHDICALLLFFTQQVCRNQHGCHFRLGAMLCFHGIYTCRELLFLLFESINLFFHFSWVLRWNRIKTLPKRMIQ